MQVKLGCFLPQDGPRPPHYAGEIVDLPEEFARRLIEAGNAEAVTVTASEPLPAPEGSY